MTDFDEESVHGDVLESMISNFEEQALAAKLEMELWQKSAPKVFELSRESLAKILAISNIKPESFELMKVTGVLIEVGVCKVPGLVQQEPITATATKKSRKKVTKKASRKR